MRPARLLLALVAAALVVAAPLAPSRPARAQTVAADGAGKAPAAAATAAPAPARAGARSAPAQPPAAAGETLAVRAFTIRFRDPGDVALLVGPQLSDRGSVTTVPVRWPNSQSFAAASTGADPRGSPVSRSRMATGSR
jgi:hypothetical protein